MLLSRETSPANLIHAYEAGRVKIGERWVEGNVLVTADRLIEHWTTVAPETLSVDDLRPAIALQPEIILLGTGTHLLMPDADLMAALAAERVGLEIMSTAAACRTYNVLVHERRRVVAALFN